MPIGAIEAYGRSESEPSFTTPMSLSDIRRLAGIGYGSLCGFAATHYRNAQFFRDAQSCRRVLRLKHEEKSEEFTKLARRLYPTATSHALLALLDIGAFPSRREDQLSTEAPVSPAGTRWSANTHSLIRIPKSASTSDVFLPFYHQFLLRFMTDASADWFTNAVKVSTHFRSLGPNQPPAQTGLITLGHLVPTVVFLIDHIAQSYKPIYLGTATLSSLDDQEVPLLSCAVTGLDTAVGTLSTLLGYSNIDGKISSMDLDREQCEQHIGRLTHDWLSRREGQQWTDDADNRTALPTYLLMNAAFTLDALCNVTRMLLSYKDRLESAGTSEEKTPAVTIKLVADLATSFNTKHSQILGTIERDLALALRRRLERCMAARNIGDDPDFDPVGLTFALRGLTLLNRRFRYTPLFRECVRTIVSVQLDNGCWPDGVATHSGDGSGTIQPSVEVAYQLVASVYTRSARTMPTDTDMAVMRLAIPAIERHARFLELTYITASQWRGWSSDRARHSRNPETWITSLAVRFLHFSAMIREAIDRADGLAKYGIEPVHRHIVRQEEGRRPLNPEAVFRDEVGDNAVFETDSLARPKEQMLTVFISPIARKMSKHRFIVRPAREGVSFILFGPPRSGKTHLVKCLSQALGWPLVSLDPNNFVQRSGETVGGMLARVFDDIQRLHDVVVLFDECEELVKSRDEHTKSESLELITGAMLTRLSDLHSRRGSLFCFATNYYHKIDRAIRAVGRFDEVMFYDRPDEAARRQIIMHIWDNKTRSRNQQYEHQLIQQPPTNLLELLVNSTAGCSYLEIEASLLKVGDWLVGKDALRTSDGGLLESGDLEKQASRVSELVATTQASRSISQLIVQSSTSRQDYFHWCSEGGLRDIDAVDGARLGDKTRNGIVSRWAKAAESTGYQAFADEIRSRWDFDTGRAKRQQLSSNGND